MSTTEQILDVRTVAGAIGAEITGVRLSGDLEESTVAAVRAAILATGWCSCATRSTSTTRPRPPSGAGWAR
jgi:hypothetical protein